MNYFEKQVVDFKQKYLFKSSEYWKKRYLEIKSKINSKVAPKILNPNSTLKYI